MIKDTLHIKAFVASSSDVSEERELLPKIFNKIIKSHNGISLEPILWEYDIDKGTYPGYNSIQDYINPNLNNCDFCIFIFYSRLGKYTLEEFELAKKLGKKALVFFKNGFLNYEQHYHSELLSFKNKIKNECLFIEYSEMADFEAKLTDQLHLVMSKHYNPIVLEQFNSSKESINNLIRLLTEKENEIAFLKESENQNINNILLIDKLEFEKQNLHKQLLDSEELGKERLQDLEELKELRRENDVNNELKNKAYSAIDEGDFNFAKELLLTASNNAIISSAQTFYEISKVSKLNLDYLEAYSYICIALEMQPNNSIYLREAAFLSEAIGYYTNCSTHYASLLNLNETTEIEKIYYSYELSQLWILLGDVEMADTFITYVYSYIEDNLEILKDCPEFSTRVFITIASLYFKNGDYNLALKWYKDILKIVQVEETNIYVGIISDKIATVYAYMGDTRKAIEYCKKALYVLELHLDQSNILITTCLAHLGQLYKQEGKCMDAVKCIMKAYLFDKIYIGEKHPRIATHYSILAGLYFSLESYFESKEFYGKSLEMDIEIYGKNHLEVARDYRGLASACRKLGELNDSLFYIKKALDIQNIDNVTDYLLLAHCNYELGKINLALDDRVNAISNFQYAKNIISKNISMEHDDIVAIDEELRKIQQNTLLSRLRNIFSTIIKNFTKIR